MLAMLRELRLRARWSRMLGVVPRGGVVLDYSEGEDGFAEAALKKVGSTGHYVLANGQSADGLFRNLKLGHADLLRATRAGQEMSVLAGAETALTCGLVRAVYCEHPEAEAFLRVRNFEAFGPLYLCRA